MSVCKVLLVGFTNVVPLVGGKSTFRDIVSRGADAPWPQSALDPKVFLNPGQIAQVWLEEEDDQ